MTRKRVAVTGMGVVSPIGNTLDEFEAALQAGRSGIRKFEALAELNFKCQVGGIPQSIDSIATAYFDEEERMAMNNCMTYACIAAMDAWTDAGLELPERPASEVLWDTGAVVGSGAGGVSEVVEDDVTGLLVEPQDVSGLARCIRVLLQWNTNLPQHEIRHIYLGAAASLRPDLIDTEKPLVNDI